MTGARGVCPGRPGSGNPLLYPRIALGMARVGQNGGVSAQNQAGAMVAMRRYARRHVRTHHAAIFHAELASQRARTRATWPGKIGSASRP